MSKSKKKKKWKLKIKSTEFNLGINFDISYSPVYNNYFMEITGEGRERFATGLDEENFQKLSNFFKGIDNKEKE